MTRARILIVDDSSVARSVLSRVVELDPDLEVAGTARNGAEAIARIERRVPDLVTLDVEMPGRGGLEVLREVRERWPDLPVVMLTSSGPAGSEASIAALLRGASDYVAKPARTGGLDDSIRILGETLLPKVKALVGAERDEPLSPLLRAGQTCSLRATDRPRREPAPEVVVIGVSTGGPPALAELFAALPATVTAPVLVVQHMPPVFTTHLAERLDSVSSLIVREAVDGEPLVGGTALVAPGDFHLAIEPSAGGAVARVARGEPEHSCRPAADVLFRSAAAAFGPRTLGVVLTGMGRDGVAGCESIVGVGGGVIAQDEATSVVWGMPGNAVRAGVVDRVLPLDRIADEIGQRFAGRGAAA